MRATWNCTQTPQRYLCSSARKCTARTRHAPALDAATGPQRADCCAQVLLAMRNSVVRAEEKALWFWSSQFEFRSQSLWLSSIRLSFLVVLVISWTHTICIRVLWLISCALAVARPISRTASSQQENKLKALGVWVGFVVESSALQRKQRKQQNRPVKWATLSKSKCQTNFTA